MEASSVRVTTVRLDLHGFTRLHEIADGPHAGERISVPIFLPLVGRGRADDEVLDFEELAQGPLFESATFELTRTSLDGIPVYRCVACRLCGESRERRLIREVEARLAERIGASIEAHRRLERKIARTRARKKASV